MASIKARLSSVEQFREQSGGDYDSILGIANDLLSRSGQLYTQTQSALDSISSQLSRAQMSHEEIKCKVESYEWNMEDAARDIERYNAEIDFIYNNPKKVTTTDSEGNEITEEVIDYAALSAAQRNRDEAYSTYNHYRDKCNEARPVLRDAEYTVSRFQNIKQGIKIVSDSIQNDIYEIKKFISAIEDEAEYNIQSLEGAIDSLQSYLASKSIFMPDGAIYQDFSSGGGGFSSGSSGGGSTDAAALSSLMTAYTKDLLSQSECPDTIDQSIMSRSWSKTSGEEWEQMRDDFQAKKNDLIKEWEIKNGRKWPTYKDDVYTDSGKLIRRAGGKYDAHHIQPLTFGGLNVADNITPLHAAVHFDKKGIHAPDGPYGKIDAYFKGC